MIAARLDRALEKLPRDYAGPGGAVAVLRDGAVLARHCWGWADVENRIPFTPQTMFLVCSITKQFTCALLLDRFPDPSVLDADLRARLPALHGEMPGVRDLCHNQSGLRDYWAQTALCGAPVESRFDQAQADRLIARTASLHFAPGTRASYVNQNFRLISEMLQARTGEDFATDLRRRILAPAGMEHARLNPDTSSVPGGTRGYEGDVEAGFRPAVNNIVWTGDAGLCACLDDMIAWERFIDASRDDPGGLYNRLSAPQHFRDGAPAAYGFGLGRSTMLGRTITTHGGGLRGWRSARLNAPAERISVVVLFNHMEDTRAAAQDLFAAVLDEPAAASPASTSPAPAGRFREPQTGLAVRLEAASDGRLRLNYAPTPDLLRPSPDGWTAGGTRIRLAPDGVWMDRPADNQSSLLQPCAGEPQPDIAGEYRCAELDAMFTCVDTGGVLYGAFSGDLGPGLMEMLQPYATDIWLYPCPRALDSTAPGDWTLQVRRDGGAVRDIVVGCWLARGLVFRRI